MLLSLLQSLVNIGALFLIYRYVLLTGGPEMLGLWSLTGGLALFVRMMDLAGAGSLARFLALAPDKARASSPAEFVDTVVLATIALIGTLVVFAYWPLSLLLAGLVDSAPMQELAQALLVYALATVVLSVIGDTHMNALDGVMRADLRSVILIVALLVFCLAALVLLPLYGLVGLAIAQLLQQVATIVLGRCALMRSIPNLSVLPRRWSSQALRQTVSYALRLQAILLTTLVMIPVSRILVTHIAGLATLGVFEAAQRIVLSILVLALAAARPLTPVFAQVHQRDLDQSRHLLARTCSRAAWVGGVLLSGVCVAGPVLSLLLLGELSELFMIYLGALSVGAFAAIASAPLTTFARGTGVLRWFVASQLLMAAATLLLCLLFGAALGADLVGLGVAAGMVVGAVVLIAGTLYHFGWRLGTLYNVRTLLAISAATALAAAGLATFALAV